MIIRMNGKLEICDFDLTLLNPLDSDKMYNLPCYDTSKIKKGH